MKQPGTAPTTTGTQLNLNTLLPLAVLGIGGLAVYKYFKAKETEKQEDKERQERITGYKAQTAQSASSIADIKRTLSASGKNSLNKDATKNVWAEISTLFNLLYNKSYKDKDFGTISKTIDALNSKKFFDVVSQFPIKKIYLLPRYYSIWSGKSKNFWQDVSKLTPNEKAKIELIFNTLQKKGYTIK